MPKRGRIIAAGVASCAAIFVAEQVLFSSYMALALNPSLPPLPHGMEWNSPAPAVVVAPAPPLVPTSIVVGLVLSLAGIGGLVLLVRSGVRTKSAVLALSVGPALALALTVISNAADLVAGPADLRAQTFTGLPALQTATDLIAMLTPLLCLLIAARWLRRRAVVAEVDSRPDAGGSA